MSILIKGMEIPKACVFCELYEGEMYWCRGAKKEIPYSSEYERAADCPLVGIPPHGKLIDASERIKVQIYDDMTEDYRMVEMTIDDLLCQGWVEANAPTIIEADVLQKRGKWIGGNGVDYVRCGCCHKDYDWVSQAQYYNFCPNCGAQMERSEE